MRCIQLVSYLALYFWGSNAIANEDYYAYYEKADTSKCEMRNLQRYWKLKDNYETKIAVTKAVKEQKPLADEIQKATAAARKEGLKDCEFWDLDFTYEDAERMASVWKLDTYEAKMRIAQKVANSTQRDVRKLIQEVRTTMPASSHPVDAFFSHGFDYCHAKMIGKAYGVGIYESKMWLGELLARGERQMVDNKLAFAQGRIDTDNAGQNICQFNETRFNYSDAEKLAKMWKTSVSEAKVTLSNKYLHGLERSLEAQLRRSK